MWTDNSLKRHIALPAQTAHPALKPDAKPVRTHYRKIAYSKIIADSALFPTRALLILQLNRQIQPTISLRAQPSTLLWAQSLDDILHRLD